MKSPRGPRRKPSQNPDVASSFLAPIMLPRMPQMTASQTMEKKTYPIRFDLQPATCVLDSLSLLSLDGPPYAKDNTNSNRPPSRRWDLAHRRRDSRREIRQSQILDAHLSPPLGCLQVSSCERSTQRFSRLFRTMRVTGQSHRIPWFAVLLNLERPTNVFDCSTFAGFWNLLPS